MYLLGSRYCDTEKLSNLAWSLFGDINGGWQRMQAICDYVNNRISSDTSIPVPIAPPRRVMRSASASAGTLRIWL